MGEAKRKREFVEEWCERMVERYGDIVVDDTGTEWTWRAALNRETHGLGVELRMPTNLERECAKAWESGFWPRWAVRPTGLAGGAG